MVKRASHDFEAIAKSIDDHLSHIRRAIQGPLNDAVESGGLTAPQLMVMRHIYRQGPTSIKAIAKAVTLSHSTVSGIIQRLEKRGAVVRQPDTADARIMLISVSAGVDAFMTSQAPNLLINPLSQKLAAAPEEDVEAIIHGLELLKAIVTS